MGSGVGGQGPRSGREAGSGGADLRSKLGEPSIIDADRFCRNARKSSERVIFLRQRERGALDARSFPFQRFAWAARS